MLIELRKQLEQIQESPPWQKRQRPMDISGSLWEGTGAPEAGEYAGWQKNIQALRRQIAEEEARQEIDRP